MTKPQQTHGLTLADHGEQVIELIFAELRKAEAKHPGWPTDPIHAVAILIEEAGEAMKEAIDITYKHGIDDSHALEQAIGKLRTELAQAGAMAIRALLHLPVSQGPEIPKPVFRPGDIVRYSDGSTALMQILGVCLNHGGKGNHYYHGVQCMGGVVMAYENEICEATQADITEWSSRQNWRSETIRHLVRRGEATGVNLT